VEGKTLDLTIQQLKLNETLKAAETAMREGKIPAEEMDAVLKEIRESTEAKWEEDKKAAEEAKKHKEEMEAQKKAAEDYKETMDDLAYSLKLYGDEQKRLAEEGAARKAAAKKDQGSLSMGLGQTTGYSANYANKQMEGLGAATGLGPKALAQKVRRAGGMEAFAKQQGIDSYDKGGFIGRDQIARVHSGEFVMNKRSVDQLGIAFLEAINKSSSGGGTSINNTINMGETTSMSTRAQARALVPEIERAVRLGIAGRKVL